MKINFGMVMCVVSMVHGLVTSAQANLRDKSGPEKHALVVAQVKELLPIVERIAGTDLADNALYVAALDELIAAEKAVAVARARVAELIDDIKAKRQ